jgi:DNA replication and repair protein RecF
VKTTSEARSSRERSPQPAARIGPLSLRDYRNFERLECEFPGPGVAIIGPNGSGKTNLLEAIYYLEVFRSFRGVPDRRLVRFEQQVFRIEGALADDGQGPESGRSVAAAYDRKRKIKKVEVEGLEADRVSAAVGKLGVAVFRLEDAEFVRGGPQARRQFLDVTLSVAEPAYLGALQRYRAVLAQRNEALRMGAPGAQVDAWSEALVASGARLTAARRRWVDEGRDRYAEYYGTISGGDQAMLRYRPSIAARDPGVDDETAVDDDEEAGSEAGGGTEAEWAERFRRALAATRDRERRRGMTLVGPHRDDMRFLVAADEGRRDLRGFGSSGQQRTAALALRLLEADRLRERLGRDPVYLLDDVFAELDEGRSRRLLELFESGRDGQVILTAPKTGDVEIRGGNLERWRIQNGRLLR